VPSVIRTYLHNFINLFYPEYCAGCGKILIRSEAALCFSCQHDLPHAHIHDERDNQIERLFWGRADVQLATAFLRMSKEGLVQRIIHELKYRENQDIGKQLGKMFALELLKSERLNSVDVLIPVPLHPKKQKMRGYNQSLCIVQGMQEILGCSIDSTTLFRTRYTESQTRKHRYQRWQNVSDLFAVRQPETLKGKEVMLIDDIITTGSTVEACVHALKKIPEVRISVGAIAYPSK